MPTKKSRVNLARTLLFAGIMLCAACSDQEHTAINSTTNSQSPVSPIASAPAITTATSASKTAGNNYLGVSSLGMSFDDLLSHFSYDATNEVDGYFWVSKKGEPLFGLSDKNDLTDKTVWMISIASPDITTDGGVHVGMTIQELLKKYPNISLSFDQDEQDIFAPDELQHGTSNNPDARIFFYVKSNDGTSLSHVSPDKYPTKDFSTNGVVSHILVYVDGNRSPKVAKQAPQSK